ncbi:MAG: hypothetical protein KAS72_12350 [Phycisphaerales bacterium]|nr:hypothetical protein [Phycisphaerales bacterium]
METEKSILTITFASGETAKYELPADKAAQYHLASKIERLMESHTLALEVDGVVIFHPMVNIRSIEFTPGPLALPEIVIRHLAVCSD